MREWERKIYEEKIDGKKEKKGNQVKSGRKKRERKKTNNVKYKSKQKNIV